MNTCTGKYMLIHDNLISLEELMPYSLSCCETHPNFASLIRFTEKKKKRTFSCPNIEKIYICQCCLQDAQTFWLDTEIKL